MTLQVSWILLSAMLSAQEAPAAISLDQQISEPASAPAQEEATEQELICRTLRPTGSRVRRIRACMVEREWVKVARAWGVGLQEIMRDTQRTAGIDALLED